MASQTLGCPFCQFEDADEYFLMLHIEELHTEGSPFVAKDQPPAVHDDDSRLRHSIARHDEAGGDDQSAPYVECPNVECGEAILLSDLNEHLDFHLAERVTLDEEQPGAPSSLPLPVPADSMHSSTRSSFPEPVADNFSTSIHPELRRGPAKLKTPRKASLLTPSTSSIRRQHDRLQSEADQESHKKEPGRLGRKDLGPYAFEGRMPDWLWKKLSDGPAVAKHNVLSRNGAVITQESVENERPGLVPTLAQLSALDHNITEAWFCHPSVVHVFALPKEGGFCGYRNIQMMISYLQGSKAYGYEKFPGRLPTIPALQDGIERAWDMGINSDARRQTGGIRGTRKYIGTPEVQALFDSIGIPSIPDAINPTATQPAYEVLLDVVEAYFSSDVAESEGAHEQQAKRVHRTTMAPIYLQQHGHSMTIIGLEKLRDGSRNLLVFDPMYKPAPALTKLVKESRIAHPHPSAMDGCRRGRKQLQKHNGFELFRLTANGPRIPAWGILESFPHTQYVYVFFDLETDTYDIYAADAFKNTFPWFMFGALFIVKEGRFARVPGDASFDRLGVPALGVGCEWNFWKKEKDITPLVLAATSSRESRHSSPSATNVLKDEQVRSPEMQPRLPTNSNEGLPCACVDCVSVALHNSLQRANTLGSAPYPRPSLNPLHSVSPLLLGPSIAAPVWYPYTEYAAPPSYSTNAFNIPGQSYQPRRPPYQRRHYEVAFPTARAFLNGGTPLSRASKAYVKAPQTASSSPLSTPPTQPRTPAVSPATTIMTPLTSPASSPPSWGVNAWSSASSYGPVTPPSQYSQLVSGDSTMAMISSPCVGSASPEIMMLGSPLVQYRGNTASGYN